ncbi:hypothetical protein [Paracnuella aquatica]|uniref:hypothetical protein n=1 Tax=Paracnuella aquatica TaxID=2268757 RepID=UPI000DEFCCDF|nr:hypothetical protein [Paracnuella aquatica]RPD48202.1 hypothetical protein DRJ53_10670 [Paracnuella aquatica]
MHKLFISIALIGLFTACKNASHPEQSIGADTTKNATATALQLDGVDRIELFFYPDPADRKNFQQLDVTDTAIIHALTRNVEQEPITQTECPHDVKMFLVRNGEVFKTVYGATADSCNYLAYAINSKPFYTRLDKDAKTLLDSLREGAK